LQRGGLYLPWIEPAPEPFEEVGLVLETPSGLVGDLRARVVHLAQGAGVALAIDCFDVARQAIEDLARSTPEGREGSSSVSWQQPQDSAADEPVAEPDPADPTDESQTLFARIRAMSAPEKMQLAMHGDRAARLVLMKDTNKAVHTFIIQNPKITIDEVRYFAAYRQANPDALKLLSEHREWMQNPGVVSALVGNPKTPAPIAVKLLDRLPPAELRRLAKSDGVPRAVQLAARRKVAGG
jgi:hypothetical protein